MDILLFQKLRNTGGAPRESGSVKFFLVIILGRDTIELQNTKLVRIICLRMRRYPMNIEEMSKHANFEPHFHQFMRGYEKNRDHGEKGVNPY